MEWGQAGRSSEMQDQTSKKEFHTTSRGFFKAAWKRERGHTPECKSIGGARAEVAPMEGLDIDDIIREHGRLVDCILLAYL